MITPTPRTDKIAHAGLDEADYIGRMTELARQLETELNETKAFIVSSKRSHEDELDIAYAKIDRLSGLVELQENIVGRVCERYGWNGLEDGARSMAKENSRLRSELSRKKESK